MHVDFVDHRKRENPNANLPTSPVHENALQALRLVQSYLLAGNDKVAPTANRFGYTRKDPSFLTGYRDLNPFSKTAPFGDSCLDES